MAVIHIDGKTYEVDGGDNLLAACLSLGIDVPYFCYHPALGSVGSCRQCAVKQYNNEEDYKAGRGRLVMSCMVAPSNDMYISVDDAEAKEFRKRVVEYLMTNHPHDCPTCEEGGHCHLQDMTYMSGQSRRRYRFSKRTHHNQDLGPFINHEMNRCIACYRCVRFYRDYAGGEDFGVYASSNRVYFGRSEDGQFESEFSGNLTEVCPTGVFTDKTHSDRYNRKWDMQYAPSVCQGCSTGCSVSVGERYGEVRRIENRYNPDVNGYFLCDKGRFAYGYLNRADRPLQPLEKTASGHIAVSADLAVDGAAALLRGKKVIGVGSASASLEDNFALRQLVGAQNYSAGELLFQQKRTKAAVDLLCHRDVIGVSVAQIEEADAVFILGEDLTQTASRAALAVRQAAKNKQKAMAQDLKTETWLAEPVRRIGQQNRSPIYTAAVQATKLDDVAKAAVVASAWDVARLGFLVGQAIEACDEGLDAVKQKAAAFDKDALLGDENEAIRYLARHIAWDLLAADKPLLISGVSLCVEAIEATAYVATALSKKRAALAQNVGDAWQSKAGVYMALRCANSFGTHLLNGKAIEELLAQEYDAVVVLENGLLHLSAEQQKALQSKTLVVLDHQSYAWHEAADFVLPAASVAEGDGTFVSAEGRAQRYFAALNKKYYAPTSQIKDAWRWLGAVDAQLQGQSESAWLHLDDVIDAMIASEPCLAPVKRAAPDASYRVTGLKIAREPRRYSGRTALRAKISVHEPMQPKDLDSALTFSMEGYVGDKIPSAALPFAWSAGWNSPQAWNKLQDKIGRRLKGGDIGVRLVDFLPKNNADYNFVDIPARPLSDLGEGHAVLAPIYDLFASGEFAYRSPVVASQIQPLAWLVSAPDAERWKLRSGDTLVVEQGDNAVALPVEVVEYMAQGCIGYTHGQLPLAAHLPATVQKVDNAPLFVPYYRRAQDDLVVFESGRSAERVS